MRASKCIEACINLKTHLTAETSHNARSTKVKKLKSERSSKYLLDDKVVQKKRYNPGKAYSTFHYSNIKSTISAEN